HARGRPDRAHRLPLPRLPPRPRAADGPRGPGRDARAPLLAGERLRLLRARGRRGAGRPPPRGARARAPRRREAEVDRREDPEPDGARAPPRGAAMSEPNATFA